MKDIGRKLITCTALVFFILSCASCGTDVVTVPKSISPASDNLLVFRYGYEKIKDADIYTVTTDGKLLRGLGCVKGRGIDGVKPLWSPDRRTIAYSDRDLTDLSQLMTSEEGKLSLMKVDGQDKTKLLRTGPKRYYRGLTSPLSWSPDSSGLWCHDRANLWFVNMQGEQILVAKGGPMVPDGVHDLMLETMALSPKGDKAAFVLRSFSGDKNKIVVYDIVNRHLRNLREVYESGTRPPVYITDRGLTSICWLDEDRFFFSEKIDRTYEPNKKSTMGRDFLPATVWLLDTRNGLKEKVFESAANENIGYLTLSPSKQQIAYLYWTPLANESDAGLNNWEKDKAPRPAVLSLQTVQVNKLTLPKFDPNIEVEYLNWSAP